MLRAPLRAKNRLSYEVEDACCLGRKSHVNPLITDRTQQQTLANSTLERHNFGQNSRSWLAGWVRKLAAFGGARRESSGFSGSALSERCVAPFPRERIRKLVAAQFEEPRDTLEGEENNARNPQENVEERSRRMMTPRGGRMKGGRRDENRGGARERKNAGWDEGSRLALVLEAILQIRRRFLVSIPPTSSGDTEQIISLIPCN
ncbi:hypothetical protein KM043_004455 [Ampulex compressa]|nr:hypothetical protein KM043_004455 [Ampulex compressa]